MIFNTDDIRAAVSGGILSELQADQLAALANARQSDQTGLASVDEPFELFRGFNEIFVVVGLGILYSGWLGLMFAGGSPGAISLLFFGVSGGAIVVALAMYFSLRRRMVAPSIALSVMFAISAIQIGFGVNDLFFAGSVYQLLVVAVTAAVMLFGFWLVFRVPFTVALIAIAIFVATISAFLTGDLNMTNPTDLFLLSAEGPLALVTFVLGIAGFILAMRFDMSDPHRVTRRSLNGFWLHIVAAPAIVNTIALTLFDNGSGAALFGLLLFIVGMALVAIIIDRRSFLLAGIGYVVALSTAVMDDSAYVAILSLGLLLVLLGASWEKFRGRMMNLLPEFPGKDRLPPYNLPITENQ